MRSLFVLLLCTLAVVFAEVTVLKAVQTLYDRSPKLRIKGSGFDADEHSIILDLAASGQASLRVDKDFLITKDEDGLILKLLSNRKWVNLDGRTPPVALILSGVRFASNPNTNLLPEPVIIANVLATPTVKPNEDIIYTTATNELRINGTGFMGAKKVDLYFNPPLYKEVGYEMVNPFPLARDQVVLRLRHGYSWREEPGPLQLVGIDTGAGPVKLNGDDGIRVAEVQADLGLHGVTVETTADQQKIYHDQSTITVKGTGFNPLGNTLRFSNGLLGKGVNFTTVSTTSESVTLRIVPGSHWRKNVENLPGYLTLLAVNAGEGFVAVGPTNAAKGRDVATVFEKPTVYSSNTKIYRTHSHELHIRGVGFVRNLGRTQVRFNPPLVENEDYTLKVIDRTELEVTLLDGHSWRSDDGPLTVTAINTKDEEDGWVSVGGEEGVHVAEVMDDLSTDVTGGVEIYPVGTKVYQSVLQEMITVTGNGFKDGMTLTLEPELKEGQDYDMEILSKNRLVLRLRNGRKWRSEPGFIIAKMIKISGKNYPLAGVDGIRIAIVLADPVIKAGKDSYHETQSKVVAIEGSGFTNAADTKIVLRPTSPGAYQVMAVLDDVIRVQLKQGYDWLPSFMSLTGNDADKKIPLQVVSLDTGAGVISYDDPITVGTIIKDREGVVCDDSCEFAFDGTCDDGTEDEYYYYYAYYGYYGDDDLGGYYGDMGGGDYYGEGADAEGGEQYGYGYSYYMPDDGYRVSACVKGTDCTDCGGVDAIVDYTKLVNDPSTDAVACTNTCPYARDGVCDDPRGANYCKLGTDCQDCGVVGADNFTRADDDGWWDDDDDYWTFNDGNFLDQNAGIEKNRHRVKKTFTPTDPVGPAMVFLSVLEGIVYTVGAIFAATALYLANRVYNGQSVAFLNVFNPEVAAAQEAELTARRVVPVTPDFIRTG